MRLTIFSRLIFGYLLIFILVSAVSVSMVYQLMHFNTITQSILNVDHRMEDLIKKLTDSLLSQMRYEKKYLILWDEALYSQFLLQGMILSSTWERSGKSPAPLSLEVCSLTLMRTTKNTRP